MQIYSSISEWFFRNQKKIITFLKFARIQRPLHSDCIKNTTVEFSFRSSFSALQRGTPSFFCFTCSFTNNAWSHAINKRNQNKSGAKALIPIYRLIVEGLKVQDAIISDVIIYPEMGISRTDRQETSKLISNFSFSPAWSAYVPVKEDWTYNSLISSLSSPSSLPKFSKIKW